MNGQLIIGDCEEALRLLDEESVHCCVTSPPYFGLRDYGVPGEVGSEESASLYIDRLVRCFREVRRVLRPDGTLWLNLGDAYAGSWGNQGRSSDAPRAKNRVHGEVYPQRTHTGSLQGAGVGVKAKDLMGLPWRVALALRSEGWYLRSEIVWVKDTCMPENVRDRPSRSHEHIFLLSKSPRYYYSAESILRDSGASARTVWRCNPSTYPGAHFATFPPSLARQMILAGCPPYGTVLDPFLGSGTTAQVAQEEGREWIGVELNESFEALILERTSQGVLVS